MSTGIVAPSQPAALVNGLLRHAWNGLEPQKVVDLLRRNKFPLLSLDLTALPQDLVDSPEFQGAIEEDLDSLETQREEYLRVREAWLESGIPHMFIKTACVRPSFPYTSDNLDILVREEQGEQAKALLRELGFVELRNIEEPQKYLFRKFRDGLSVCAVHVHHWVGWNINFFEEEPLWSRARVSSDDDAVLAPSPEDALLINLAHAFYENKRFTLHDLEKMRANWNGHALDWDYLPQVPQRRGWYDGFLLGILLAAHLEEALTGETKVPERYRRQWELELSTYGRAYRYYRGLIERPVVMPFRVSFMFSKVLYYQKIWRDAHDSPLARVRNIVYTLVWGFKLKTGIRPQRSMLVSLSGMDGSGKTGQASALMDILRRTEVKASYYWNRVGCSPWTRMTSRVFKLLSGRRTQGDGGGRGQLDLEGRSGLIQGLWAWNMAIDLAVRYTLRVRLPLLLGKLGFGRVIVCDRYVLDAEAEVATRVGPPGIAVRAALAFLRLTSPRPDIAYVLDVPERVAKERHALPVTEEELQLYRARCLDLAPRAGARVLDGTRYASDIGDEVAGEVLRRWEARYPTLLNGLLLSNPSQRNPKSRSREA